MLPITNNSLLSLPHLNSQQRDLTRMVNVVLKCSMKHHVKRATHAEDLC